MPSEFETYYIYRSSYLTYLVDNGSSIKLEAKEFDGYEFVGWIINNDVYSENKTIFVNVNKRQEIFAMFGEVI